MIVKAPWWLRAITPTGVFRLSDHDKAADLGLPALESRFGKVYITFDDGPVPEVTPWVLDTLDRFGVKATFFMVGENIIRYPRLAAEVCRRGHRVANHAHRHRPGFKSMTLTYLDDARRAEEEIAKIAEETATEKQDIAVRRVFRPPHGYIRLMQLCALRLNGYSVILFDVVSRDYDRSLTPEDVVSNVMDNVRDGSLIVFHDSVKAFPRLKTALPKILSQLMGNS